MAGPPTSALTPELVATLWSYLPRLVVRRRIQDPRPLERADRHALAGAVLLADVSGFTRLSAQLAARGPAGIEALTGLLNACFGQLISRIQADGGDIVKFAGDALLAVWPIAGASWTGTLPPADLSAAALNESLTEALQRAAGCALALVDDDLPAGPETGGLRLRVAVSAGEIEVLHLGGIFGRWEVVVTGEPLADLAPALQSAQPGQAAVAARAWPRLADSAIGDPIGAFAVRLRQVRPLPPIPLPAEDPLTEADANVLRSYLPGAIVSRISAGQRSWLSELRQVTVLFVNLPEITHRALLERSQAAVRALQVELYRQEGSLNKLSVDDKGVSVVAVLGLPPLAHEDDAVRGTRAALAIRSALAALGIECAIGIASGTAFCGEVGSVARREYTVMGDTVNLAARLMQAAGRDILCDGATRRRAGVRHRFAVLEPLALKGMDEPVPVFRPLGEDQDGKGVLVGRLAERAALEDLLAAVAGGEAGRVAIVEGEPGSGKTRLVETVLAAPPPGLAILCGAGDPIERTSPYRAWRGVFARLLGAEGPEADPAAVLERAGDLLGGDAFRMAQTSLLGVVLPFDLPATPLAADLAPSERAELTRDLLVALLEAAARRAPLLVALEDGHWLDTASWQLAAAAVRSGAPLGILVSTRSVAGQMPPGFDRLAIQAGRWHLKLGALDPEEAVALVASRLGVTVIPEAIADLVRERSGGQPFFCEELAHALHDSGILAFEGRACEVAGDAEDIRQVPLPTSLHGAIRSRVDRLHPSCQFTLKVASVIGRSFPYRALSAVHPIASDRPDLKDHLSMLAQLDLTQQESPEPDLAYLFKHAITHEVVYDLLLFSQRREIHRAVASWYEGTHRADLAPWYGLLAHHWLHAEEPASARRYYDLTGVRALESGSYREAIALFDQAIALDRTDDTRGRGDRARENRLRQARRLRFLGRAHLGLGEVANCCRRLEAGLRLLGHGAGPLRAGNIPWALGRVAAQVLHRLVPRFFMHCQFGRTDELLEAARAYLGLAEAYYYQSLPLSSLLAALSGLSLAEKASPSPELVRAYALMGVSLGFGPFHPLARRYRRMAESALPEAGKAADRAYVRQIGAMYDVGIGRLQAARTANEEALEIYTSLGHRRRMDEIRAVQAWQERVEGRLPACEDLCHGLLASCRRRGDGQTEAAALFLLGLVAWTRGEAAAALELGREAEATDRETDSTETMQARALQAVALADLGRLVEAGERAAAAARLAYDVMPTAIYTLDGYAALAETYLALWQAAPRADRHARTRDVVVAVHVLEFFARTFPLGRARYHLLAGRWAAMRDKPRNALRHWREGALAARSCGLDMDAAILDLELGLARQDADPARGSELSAARQTLATIGAMRWAGATTPGRHA